MSSKSWKPSWPPRDPGPKEKIDSYVDQLKKSADKIKEDGWDDLIEDTQRVFVDPRDVADVKSKGTQDEH